MQYQITNCPKKIASRNVIISNYNSIFGRNDLSIEKQYWTLCGRSVSDKREVLPYCEYKQLIDSKFITPEQYHGVDNDKEIIEANKHIKPITNWHHGDFHREMIKFKAKNYFNPGVVNFDSMGFISTQAEIFANILSTLSKIKDVMVVGNFVIKNRFTNENNGDDIINELNNSFIFQDAITEGDWKLEKELYNYNGTGKRSNTKMGSVCFWR